MRIDACSQKQTLIVGGELGARKVRLKGRLREIGGGLLDVAHNTNNCVANPFIPGQRAAKIDLFTDRAILGKETFGYRFIDNDY
jgi:hypothetical protein